MEEKKEENQIKRIIYLIGTIIYYIIVIPLAIVTIMIVYQSIRYPEKIPNIFGYKMFMVLNTYVDDPILYGDLIFSKNTNVDNLRKKDVIVFRTDKSTIISFSKIIDINKTSNSSTKIDLLKTKNNDVESINDSEVEGLVVCQVHKIGLIFAYLQEPFGLLSVESIILIIGLIYYYIVQEQENKKENKKEKIV